MDAISKIDKLTDREIFYFRQRNRNKIFQTVVAHFADEAANGLTKSELARRLGKDPAQITRWFSGPGNWTLDTVSDLLLSMDCELDFFCKAVNLRTKGDLAEIEPRTPQTSTTSSIQRANWANIG